MSRCPHHLADDPSALQCARPNDGHTTHVFEHTTVTDHHDESEQAADPC